MNGLKKILAIALCAIPCLTFAGEFTLSAKSQLRVDDRSSKDLRAQYRLRTYANYQLDDKPWSLHLFAATGKDFASSHNTLNAGINDYFYLRRLYLRRDNSQGGKTELGIIPTYKGRVSSTGLSKDGWIKGLRHVQQINADIKAELVIGELANTDPSKIFDAIHGVDYVEMELSATIDQHSSFEFSLERMTARNFARAEYRYALLPDTNIAFELIHRLDSGKVKTVVGLEGEFDLLSQALAYFVYHSYVSPQFGLRAELTEDFITTGHGISSEIKGDFGKSNWGWFARFDAYQSNTRLLAGVSVSLQ